MLPGWWFDDVFPHHFQVLNYLYLGVAPMSTPKNRPMSITYPMAPTRKTRGQLDIAHVWPGGRVRTKPLMKRMQTNL